MRELIVIAAIHNVVVEVRKFVRCRLLFVVFQHLLELIQLSPVHWTLIVMRWFGSIIERVLDKSFGNDLLGWTRVHLVFGQTVHHELGPIVAQMAEIIT